MLGLKTAVRDFPSRVTYKTTQLKCILIDMTQTFSFQYSFVTSKL